MTVGLIMLAVMAISLFVSFGRNAFRGLGLPQWGAFMVILAFAVGIIVPEIRLGRVGYISVGGFILPIVASVILAIRLVVKNGLWRALIAMVAVVAITTGLLLVMPMRTTGLRVLTFIAVGMVSGAVAFIIGRTRMASVFALLSGIPVGNLVSSLISYFILDAGSIALGWSVVYNALFLSVIFALVLSEIAYVTGKSSGSYTTQKRSLNFEAGRDEQKEEYDNFDDDLF